MRIIFDETDKREIKAAAMEEFKTKVTDEDIKKLASSMKYDFLYSKLAARIVYEIK